MDPTGTRDAIAQQIVDAAFSVHVALGPGLLESVYEQCLAHELRLRQMHVDLQVSIPITYRGLILDRGFRMDLVVANTVVVEVKAVESLLGIHEAQLLTYLKLSSKPLGLLINFNVRLIKDGIRRLILKS